MPKKTMLVKFSDCESAHFGCLLIFLLFIYCPRLVHSFNIMQEYFNTF